MPRLPVPAAPLATLLTARPQLGTIPLTLLIALYLALFDNGAFWQVVLDTFRGDDLRSFAFLISVPLFLTALFSLLIGVIGFPYLLKPAAAILLLISAAVGYFSETYGIAVDRVMFQNLLETNPAESGELLTPKLVFHLLLFGAVPALLVARVRIRYQRLRRELLNKLILAIGGTVLLAGVVGIFYADYASLTQNHRQIRHLINPLNYLHAVESYLRHASAVAATPPTPIGEDARLIAAGRPAGHRRLVVLVVGETARAANFSLNGYPRDTNPELQAAGVINFGNFTSCGTSTAVSVPCIFSHLDREGFDQGAGGRYESLLDVVARAGVEVLWRDNNTGCKGACDRVSYQDLSHGDFPTLCGDEGCLDEVLLEGLNEEVARREGDLLVVLHQQGSHGPAYHLRSPQEFKRFLPECTTGQLQDCTREEVVNAYDNTLLYTDHFLGRVIEWLRGQEGEFDTAMLYASDHGESLGENHVYLHGLPYFMAPEEQTHVPFVVWLSAGMRGPGGVDAACLSRRTAGDHSHDNLFHSVLGLMGVATSLYDDGLDLFAGCRIAPGEAHASSAAAGFS